MKEVEEEQSGELLKEVEEEQSGEQAVSPDNQQGNVKAHTSLFTMYSLSVRHF